MPSDTSPLSLDERRKSIAMLEALHAGARRENAGTNQAAADNPYSVVDHPMLIAFTGDEGSGKSLSMTGWLVRAYAAGYRVVTNGAVFFGETLDFNLWQQGGYYNCIIGIDELYELFARYRAQSRIQVEAVGSLITLRHQRIQLLVAAQNLDEINRSVAARIGLEIRCYNNDGGYNVFQIRRLEPRHRRYSRNVRRVLSVNMRRYWPFYDHERHIEIGELRKTPEERRATKELGLTEACYRCAAGFVAAGDEYVTAVKIQLALKEHEGITASTTRIGLILGGLGFEPRRSSKVRAWEPPRSFLDEYHPAGAVAQAAAALKEEPLVEAEDDEAVA